MSPHRSPLLRPMFASAAGSWRRIAVLDDKVALVLVKLGHLAVQKDREAYLRGLVDLCSQAVDAERCTVYIVNHKKKELWARVAQRTATEIRLPMGQGLAGQAATTGETRCCSSRSPRRSDRCSNTSPSRADVGRATQTRAAHEAAPEDRPQGDHGVEARPHPGHDPPAHVDHRSGRALARHGPGDDNAARCGPDRKSVV